MQPDMPPEAMEMEKEKILFCVVFLRRTDAIMYRIMAVYEDNQEDWYTDENFGLLKLNLAKVTQQCFSQS